MMSERPIKPIVQLLHQIVRCLNLEKLFLAFSKYHSAFAKFLPLPHDYSKEDSTLAIRDSVRFLLNRSDYMQWHVFAALPDNSWKAVLEHLKTDAVIFDVGANCGAFSLKLAKVCIDRGFENARIIAFEPNPRMVDVFKRNLALNEKLEKIVELQPIALGKIDGQCIVTFNDQNTGGGQATAMPEGTVAMRKIDNIVDETKINRIDFIKIDVEGFEPDVLAGAMNTLKTQKPALYLEMTEEWFKKRDSSCEAIIQFLWSLGYHLLLDDEKNLVPVSRENLSMLKNISQYNLLAKRSK